MYQYFIMYKKFPSLIIIKKNNNITYYTYIFSIFVKLSLRTIILSIYKNIYDNAKRTIAKNIKI